MSQRRNIVDRNPLICAAGIKTPILSSAEGCLHIYRTVDAIEATRKEMGIPEKPPFQYKLPTVTTDRNCGIYTETREILQPEPKSNFEMFENDMHESIYDSYKNRPLGEQRRALSKPDDVTITSQTFGKLCVRDPPAYDAIFPNKKQHEIIAEIKSGHRNYVKSHFDYYPSEQIDRSYCRECFNPNQRFGKVTYADVSGGCAKKCLVYPFYPSHVCLINHVQQDHRSRTRAPVGKPLEANKNRLKLPEDFTYGKPIKKMKFGAGDLLKEADPCEKKKALLDCVGYFNKLRLHFKQKQINFQDLLVYIRHEDVDDTGIIRVDKLLKLLASVNITFNLDKVIFMMKYFGYIDCDCNVRYSEFISLLNLKNPFPELGKVQDLPPEKRYYETTYQSILKDPEKYPVNPNLQKAGLSTMRYDSEYPYTGTLNLRFLACNLPAETTVEALIAPSAATVYGLSHRDYMLPRSKEQMHRIFTNAGIDLNPPEWFDEQWNECVKQDNHPDKLVCVETFRNRLDYVTGENWKEQLK